MNQTELTKRIRRCAMKARAMSGLPRRCPVEVGLRNHRVVLTDKPTTVAECIHPDDDLFDFVRIPDWAKHYGTAGEVVHLYFHASGEFGELLDVITVWVGTADHPPMVVEVPLDKRTLVEA